MQSTPAWALWLPLLGVIVGATLTFIFQTCQAKRAHTAALEDRDAEWKRQDIADALRRYEEQTNRDRETLVSVLQDVHYSSSRCLGAYFKVLIYNAGINIETSEIDQSLDEWAKGQQRLVSATVLGGAVDEAVGKAVYEFRTFLWDIPNLAEHSARPEVVDQDALHQAMEKHGAAAEELRTRCEAAVVAWLHTRRASAPEATGTTPAQTATHEMHIDGNGTDETGDASK